MKRILLLTMVFFSIFSYAQFPEGFEGATFPPTGWVVGDNGVGTAQSWGRTNAAGFGWVHQGTWSAMVNRDGGATSAGLAQDWLITPQVTVPTNGQLRFYARSGSNGEQGSVYKVLLSTTGQSRASFTTTLATYTELEIQNLPFQQLFILLNAYAGQNVYFAFVMEVNNGLGDRWILDDVKVDQQCLTPTALNVTPFSTTANLSWTSPNPAGPWQIEYGPQGFVQGTGTIVNNILTNSHTLTGLSPLTSYSYYVRTICEADNVSPWSVVRNFTTTVAPPICGGNFVDPGGATGPYPGNFNNTATPVVICPTNPGEIVTVTFSSFNTEPNWDALYVYDGPTTASPLIASGNPAGNGGIPAGGYWGTTIPGPFTSSHPSGCLTFVFRSDGIDNRDGWTANITCAPPPNYCAGDHFYDNGGPTGNYTNNITSTRGYKKICPPAGQSVTVFFNSFDVADDTFSIYDGDDLATALLVGTYSGTGIIPSYTASNPAGNGCLIFVFTSNASTNASGWDASIVCGPPCQSISSSIVGSSPPRGADTVIRVCQNQSFTIDGAAVFGNDGTGATYHWDFGDGNTAIGQSVSHSYSAPGIYSISLYTKDAVGCRSVNRINQLVYVSTTPSFTGTLAADEEICLGQSTIITGAVTPQQYVRNCAPPTAGVTILSDNVGQLFSTPIPVDCFPVGSTLTSANQIVSVCLNIEHSYLGDLLIRLTSPSGQSIILKAYPGGAGTYLGCPIDDGNDPPAPAPPLQGVGRDYCFTPTATTLLVNGATSNCGTPNGASINAGNYMPVQPFSNLIGSTLNGDWTLTIIDNLNADNGHIFSWSINFDSSLLPTDYQFTPTIASSNWSPDPTITSVSGNQITVTPTVIGPHCYTYNVTDNFGCTYSTQVCIDVVPGVEFTDITASPTQICNGGDGVYTFTGTPNAIVTYNINGGANQTITLDGTGSATLTLTGLNLTTDINVTYMTAPSVPTAGNAITTVGGVNPNNSTGAILAAGTTANTANSTTINSSNTTVTLTLAHVVPAGTPITVSLAKNTTTGAVNIVDGPSTLLFNTGAINILQHVTFIKGTTSNTITINRANGTVFLDGVSYNYNELGCDRPLNDSASIVVYATPIVSVTPATCTANGSAIITNYNPTFTYVFNPLGPSIDASGAILNATFGTSYTVALDNVACLTSPSPFVIDAILQNLPTPIINTTPPTCLADGFSTITNYDGTATYTFTPAGPSVDATGLITGMVLGNSYTVIASNTTCDSNPSTPFSNLIMLVTPVVPTVSVTPPTCAANGFATITNYDPAITYVFTPAGPTVDASGVISGMAFNTNYEVAASNGSCTSVNSAIFTIDPILVTPAIPIISMTAPTCLADGFSTITNYDGTLTYTFNPAGPSVDATGLISGMTLNTLYEVTASNTTCTSVASAQFNNLVMLVTPVVPTVSVTPPTCAANGFATITNYDPAITYVFTPAGPTVDASGVISGMAFNTNYEVAASNGSCTSANSAIFTIDPILVTPAVPVISMTAPTCLADGFSTITNYDATLTYVFNPAGPSVDATGLISGMTLNTLYEVTASNTTCTSVASAQFSNLPILVTPVVPTVSITAPTCTADGFATITNYDPAITYVFTPAGPTVDASGVISGMAFNTNYEVAASNGSCTSVNSAIFTIDPILVTPAVPVISMTAPTCLADGFSTITNYDATLTYVFNPAGPTVDATGLISGMTLNTLYEVTASNATCTSVASAQFSNLPILVTPVVPTFSITAPTCIADGFARITNYDAAITYVFTPAGPSVDATGLISGMLFATNYEVAASNGSCTSINSAIFTISQRLPQPTIFNITNNGPICIGSTATFTINATPNSQVDYSVDGNPVQTVAINSSGIGVVNVAGVTASTTINTISIFDGICSSNIALNSTVSLFADTTISLVSPASTENQTRCAGVTIDPIQYQVTGTATGVTVTGLPIGVTHNYNATTGLLTISGAVNNGGVYNYFITTSGGCNPQATESGSITITPRPTLSYTVTNTVCDGNPLDFVLSSNLPNTTYSWSATVSNISGSYSTLTNGDETNINQIATLTNPETIGTITMIIIPRANGCDGIPSNPITITVNPNPVIESVTVADSSVCSATNSTNNVHVDIVGNISGITYTWTAITNGVNVVGGVTSGTITATSTTAALDLQVITSNPLVAGTIYFEVSSVRNGCPGNTLQSGVVTVNPNPGLPISSPIKTICSGNNSDLIVDVSPLIAGTELTWEVLTVFNVSGANPGTGIAPVTINDVLTATTNTQGYVIYRVRSSLGECQGGYTDYRVNVNPAPLPKLVDGNICITADGEVYQTYTLNTGLNDADYDFEWFDTNGNTIPGATSSTLVVDEAGTYSVIATNWLTGCSSDPLLASATATVTETLPATSMTVVQSEYFSDNATITVNVTGGSGTLMYSLDEGTLQTSNVFTNVSAGPHKITVIDTQGCTYFTYDVFVIGYPQYFTPNGDGINDTWYIDGLQNSDVIYIFDRYGKLIKQLRGIEGWDGTYNQENLPSTDYWFTVDYLENGAKKQFKAHFSLKR